MFTATTKHRHRKCDLFIYLLICRAQREHKTISIIALKVL